jgi:hypothetical protein
LSEACLVAGSGFVSKAEYDFLELYETAKTVYKELSERLAGLNKIIHA